MEEINQNNFDINKVYRKFLTENPRILIKEINWEDKEMHPQNNNQFNEINQFKMENQQFLQENDDPFGLKENSFFFGN